MNGKIISEISVGDTAVFSKTIAECDVYGYAGITGDFNRAHMDKEYASGTIFKDRIAHGMLSAGLISTILGTLLPGPGTIYLSQTLQFKAPVYIGDTITARAEVIELIPEKNRALLKTTCSNQKGNVVITGEALVMPPRQE